MHNVLKTAERKMHSHFDKKKKVNNKKKTTCTEWRKEQIKQRLKALYSPLKDEVIKKSHLLTPPFQTWIQPLPIAV